MKIMLTVLGIAGFIYIALCAAGLHVLSSDDRAYARKQREKLGVF